MAQDVQIITLCDECIGGGVKTDAIVSRQITIADPNENEPNVTVAIDLCADHAEPLARLFVQLETYGNRLPQRGAIRQPAQREREPHKLTPCPDPTCTYAGAPSASALSQHSRHTHGMTITKLRAAHGVQVYGAKPVWCPYCGERVGAPQGLFQHVNHHHADAFDQWMSDGKPRGSEPEQTGGQVEQLPTQPQLEQQPAAAWG